MVLRNVRRMLALFALILPASGQAPAEIGPSPASPTAPPSNRQQHHTATSDSAVDLFMTKLTPHPYIFVGPSLMGGGYAPVAYRVEGGLNVESTRYLMSVSAAYDNGHQVNDGDQPNPKGLSLAMQISAFSIASKEHSPPRSIDRTRIPIVCLTQNQTSPR